MGGKEFILKSNAKLFVSYMAFEDGLAFFKSVSGFMAQNNLIPKTAEDKMDPSSVFLLFRDPDIYSWYKIACERATYESVKINSDLFDNMKLGPKACHDMMEMFETITNFNVARFFPLASSESKVPSLAAAGQS